MDDITPLVLAHFAACNLRLISKAWHQIADSLLGIELTNLQDGQHCSKFPLYVLVRQLGANEIIKRLMVYHYKSADRAPILKDWALFELFDSIEYDQVSHLHHEYHMCIKVNITSSESLTKLLGAKYRSCVKIAEISNDVAMLHYKELTPDVWQRAKLSEDVIHLYLHHGASCAIYDIITYQDLSPKFIDEHIDILISHAPWTMDIFRILGTRHYLSIEILTKYKDKWPWVAITKKQADTPERILKFKHCWHLFNITPSIVLPDEYLEKRESELDWSEISEHRVFTVDQLRKYAPRLQWRKIIQNPEIHLSAAEKVEFIGYIWPANQ